MPRCVALLSGDLDGAVAAALVQRQGIEVHGLAYATPFSPIADAARNSAEQLQIPLRIVDADPIAYLRLIGRPRFGYGKGANPCCDCRLAMLAAAVAYLREIDGQFVVTGEVLGQKMMGQKRAHLEMLEHHAGIPGRLVRPLSAKLLVPTLPETEGLLDRDRFYGVHGSGRRKIRELAKRFGLTGSDKGAARCRLVDPTYGQRLLSALGSKLPPAWLLPGLFELARSQWVEDRGLIVQGKNRQENECLTRIFSQLPADETILLATPDGFSGPTFLSLGLKPPEAEPLILASLRERDIRGEADRHLSVTDKRTSWRLAYG